ncbi:hypothetical protein FJY90_07325 [Candidatus Gottesmanbacteria bacterium]|nr:hypothetical protein [Candidatus Gottesmanbacteria bacterium]
MNKTDKAYIDGMMEYAETVGRISDYCGFQFTHCQNQIKTLDKAIKEIKYKFIRQEARDQKNIYIGRLQAVKKIMEFLGIEPQDYQALQKEVKND